MPGENSMMFGKTKFDRPGVPKGVNASPFFGVTRPMGFNADWNPRARGGALAAQGWAGTFPDKVAGIDRGRVICDGRGM